MQRPLTEYIILMVYYSNETYYILHINYCSYINLPICNDLATEINEVMENPTADNLVFFGITKRSILLELKSIHFP